MLGDIYGIGAVLYHCLSGKRLFFHVAQKDLYQAVLAGRFVSLTKVAPRIPRTLRNIVHRCLARDPAKRYPSSAAFRAELDLFLADQGIWGSRAERLAGFIRSVDELPAGQTLDSIEIVVTDPIVRRQMLRPVLWVIIALLLLGLGAFGFWGALRLGWLEPVLEALRLSGRV